MAVDLEPTQHGEKAGSRLLPASAVVLIAIVVVLAMRAMGRRWWCAMRDPSLFVAGTGSVHNSQHFFDWYSFSHLLHGVLFFWVLWALVRKGWIQKRWMLPIALAVEAGWEILENSPMVIERYRQTASALYEGDSVVNALGDLAFCAAGFYLAKAVGWRWSLGVLVMLEVVMLLAIRDNLTLNVLMLIYPFPAIRAWQIAA